MSKILLVDDDKNLSAEILEYLRAQLFTVDSVSTIKSARDYVIAASYDLIILDFNLPDGTGIELLKEIRSRGLLTPVLMLTNMSDINSKEAGFNSGTDDYLTKPFHPKELVLRIDSLLRRPSQMQDKLLKAGELCLDTTSRIVSLAGEQLSLLPKEYALLEFLMRHPNQVFSAESLLDKVWATDSDSSAETVVMTISRLRKKIGKEKCAIKNVFGVGYKLEVN